MEKLSDLLLSLSDAPAKFADKGVVRCPPLPGLHINSNLPISVPLLFAEEQVQKIKSIASNISLDGKSPPEEGDGKVWGLRAEQLSFKNNVFENKVKDNIFYFVLKNVVF